MIGVRGTVPTVPPDTAFAEADTWALRRNAPVGNSLSDVLHRVDYAGDLARLSSEGTVVDDNFFNGLPWEVGFPPTSGESLELQVLPMSATHPIYLDPTLRKPSSLKAELFPEYETIVAADF